MIRMWISAGIVCLVVLLAGCAAQVGVNRINLNDRFQKMNRNALNASEPSERTELFMFQRDLEDEWEEDEDVKEVEEDKAIEAESEKSDFDKAVEAIVSKKEFYTKESIDKKIFQLHNVFLQNRGTVKGTECQEREEILKAAGEIMFK